MKFWRGPVCRGSDKNYEDSEQPKRGRPHTVSLFFQFLMTLKRLRLNLPLLLLADLFCTSTTTVSEVTTTWIAYMHQTLVPAVVFWPSQSVVCENMPYAFRKLFPSVRVIIDCTEFLIDRPANKDEQYKTFSQYKSHNTYKCLIGINPNGAFSFLSSLWGRNASDRHITEHCGLLDKLEQGDAVMADRGFHIEDILLTKGANLIASPFTRKTNSGVGKRLNTSEMRKKHETLQDSGYMLKGQSRDSRLSES